MACQSQSCPKETGSSQHPASVWLYWFSKAVVCCDAWCGQVYHQPPRMLLLAPHILTDQSVHAKICQGIGLFTPCSMVPLMFRGVVATIFGHPQAAQLWEVHNTPPIVGKSTPVKWWLTAGPATLLMIMPLAAHGTNRNVSRTPDSGAGSLELQIGTSKVIRVQFDYSSRPDVPY